MWQGLGFVAWCLSGILLGAWTAACLAALTVGRYIAAEWSSKKAQNTRDIVTIVFLALLMSVTALTWEGMSSLLPALAGVIATYATTQIRGASTRLALAFASALWGVNAWAWGETCGMIVSAGAALAGCVGAWRLHHAGNAPLSRQSMKDQAA